MATAGSIAANLTVKAGNWNSSFQKAVAPVKALRTSSMETKTAVGSLSQTVTEAGKASATAATQLAALNAGVAKLDASTVDTLKTSTEGLLPAAEQASEKLSGLSTDVAMASRVITPLTANYDRLGAAVRITNTGLGEASLVASASVGALQGISYFLGLVADGLGVVTSMAGMMGGVVLFVFRSMLTMAGVVLSPIRMVAGAMVMVGKAVVAVVAPILKTWFAFKTLGFAFKSFSLQMALMAKALTLLPPKYRAVAVALAGVGVVSRALPRTTALAVRGLQLLGMAGKAATLPLLAIRNPAAAARRVITLTGQASAMAAGMVRRFAGAMNRAGRAAGGVAFSGLKKLGGATLGVIGGFAGMIAKAAKWAGLMAVAGVGWGVKLVAESETAQTAFATLLRSGDKARLLLSKLKTFAASTPFALSDLRDGARRLLSFGVASGAIMGRLKMLGDIAAGTNSNIGDLATIFGRIKATGRASLDQINQLADRSIPIYAALAETMGRAESDIRDLASQGKIGFAEIDAALQSTTAAGGVFAGGMLAQSQTLSGLWSTMKDNAGFAFEAIAGMLSDSFDFKGLMAGGIEFLQSVTTRVHAVKPAFVAVRNVAVAAWSAISEIASVSLGLISSGTGSTFGAVLEWFTIFAATAEFAFLNWPTIAELAFQKTALAGLSMFNGIGFFFTDQMPAWLSWFGDNWKSVFFTAFDLVSTVFINMGTNIRNIMGEIWAFIASGGTAELQLAWKPLTDGFVNSLRELPDIPKRELSALETQMQADIDAKGSQLQTGLNTIVTERLQQLNDLQKPVAENLNTELDAPSGGGGGEQKASKAPKSVVDSLNRGSEAALKAIFAARNKDRTPEQQLATQKQMAKSLANIERRPALELPVAPPA